MVSRGDEGSDGRRIDRKCTVAVSERDAWGWWDGDFFTRYPIVFAERKWRLQLRDLKASIGLRYEGLEY